MHTRMGELSRVFLKRQMGIGNKSKIIEEIVIYTWQ